LSRQQVRLLAAGLAVGEQTGFLECPFCLASHENKFSIIRRAEGLVYNCFRASCPARGFVSTSAYDLGSSPVVTPVKAPRPYKKPLEPIDSEDRRFFRRTWGLQADSFMVTLDDEYALPILNPIGYRKGWVIRQPRWKGRHCHRKGNPDRPKALTYKDEVKHSRLSWSYGKQDTLVIVEDILSAWKVGQSGGGRGVALNGADMGYAEVEEIETYNPARVVIWLDPDATSAAYRLQAKWGLCFRDCTVITSNADPKDISKDEIHERINANVGCESHISSAEQQGCL